jgi:flagellar motor protein MotB
MFDFDVERHPADTRNAGWMVTLVDLISLLLSFFVLVYAGSALPVPAWEATSRSLRTAFGGITGPAQPMPPGPPAVSPHAGDASSTAYLAAVIAAALGNDPAITGDGHHDRGGVIDALGDGAEPANSHDQSIPRMTWWPHKGTQEWVQYEFTQPRKISTVAVYWFDDLPGGGCSVPQAWRVLYRQGNEWREVANPKASPIGKDKFNQMAFDAVETTALRLEVDLKPQFSGGILEWTVGE